MASSSSDDTQQRLLRARIQLALQQPFLASALMRLPFRECIGVSWCTTMATDGYHIFYSPSWVSRLADAEIRGVLAHEVLHVIFAHTDRAGARDPFRWNLACDYAINLLLFELGFLLTTGGALSAAFAGMTAEEIYEHQRLGKESATKAAGLPQPQPGLDAAGVIADAGQDLLMPEDARVIAMRDPDMPDREQLAELIATLRRGAEVRLQGRAAAYFKLECEAAERTKVDWVALLRQWMLDRVKSDWSSIPFSKRHLHRGLYLPSPSVQAPGHVVFAIDTSGSMDDASLEEILGEVRAYRETFPCRLTVIQADADVQSVTTYGELDGAELPRRMALMGRGGTDFRPVFDWVRERAEQSVTLVIYATDGYGRYPDREPEWPTIWLLTREGLPSERVPFGLCGRVS
jgi:predicted metal-dependent peptidase